jgi:hypothetical protein
MIVFSNAGEVDLLYPDLSTSFEDPGQLTQLTQELICSINGSPNNYDDCRLFGLTNQTKEVIEVETIITFNMLSF